MKYSFLILLIFQSLNSLQSQTFEGAYEDGYERLEFHHDSVDFLIGTNGGLIYSIVGTGIYSLSDSFLIIENLDSTEAFHHLLNPNKFSSDTNNLIYADKGYTIFSIKEMTTCSIKCILLSYEFELKTNTKKSLRKLSRTANRIPYLIGRERTYKKVECL